MKLSIRLTTIAITAVAFAGVLGAQQRSCGRTGRARAGRARAQARRAQPVTRASRRACAADVRAQRYRAAILRRSRCASERFTRANVQTRRAPCRGRNDVARPRRCSGAERTSAAAMSYRPVGGRRRTGRPLITRGGVVDSARLRARGVSRRALRRRIQSLGWPPRAAGRLGQSRHLRRVLPGAYAGYCEAVPYDYDYLLPPMAPSYDPCLFGDRMVVYDRFSRSIVFAAAL